MNDAKPMRRVERIDNRDGQFEHRFHRQRCAIDTPAQRLALQHFHHEKRMAVVLADVVQRADVRVIQRRRRACLALESLQSDRIARERVGQKLHRHLPSETRVLGAVDDAHSALPNLLEETIVRDGFANHC
jgi:hypothetical protein